MSLRQSPRLRPADERFSPAGSGILQALFLASLHGDFACSVFSHPRPATEISRITPIAPFCGCGEGAGRISAFLSPWTQVCSNSRAWGMSRVKGTYLGAIQCQQSNSVSVVADELHLEC